MSKRGRLLIVLLVVVVCGVFLWPTYNWYFNVPQDMKDLSAASREQIREYSVTMAENDLENLQSLAVKDSESIIPEKYDFLVEYAEEQYKIEDKGFPSSWTVKDVLGTFNNRDKALRTIENYYADLLLGYKDKRNNVLQLGLDLSGGMSILLEADMESLEKRLQHPPTADEQSAAVNQAIEILNNRIDKFGVTEPQIRKQGDTEIAIEIPGAADPDRVNTFLQGKGSLNFHIVNDEGTAAWNAHKASKAGKLLDDDGRPLDESVLDVGLIVRGFYSKDSYGVDQYLRDLVIYEEPGLDGVHIVNAQVGSDSVTGRPVINFTLDKEGGEMFYQLTSSHVGQTLAIVLDDKVKAGARISEGIRESVRMSGFERQEANDLALVLRTAAMPVDLRVVNQQSVGASLGEDSIQEGLKAITYGFLLVIAFMLIYYKGAGLVADIALLLNLFFIIAILSAFNLTLTLTSIAGLILTVGMAVDANVIIFERIKEEYRLGKSVEASIKAGFAKAFWTVMDANLTTLIAALFLSQIGSGPVQGFAYTLAVGIVSSMFTALFVSRLLFDFSTQKLHIKKLSIGWRVK
ncbi:MAG: protein translocase subunit SecD [Spirochaetales bacterium]|nr:protein translocase subunit SecD [Spirochaetales bacterium]